MPIFVLAFVLFCSAMPASAATEHHEEFGQTLNGGEIDRKICDRVRYAMGIPKIDPLAPMMMLDCRERFSKITDPRPPYTWMESREEAVAICRRYIERSSFDGSSDFVEIIETRDLEECIEVELSN